jgi:Protein of unknown function (DUF1236)
MINRFMISVAAAALIASSGLANAQGTGMSREAPSGGATMQQGAPSSDRGATTAMPGNRDAAEPTAQSTDKSASPDKSAQSEPKAPAGAKSQRADDNMKGQKSKSMSADDAAKGGKDMKAEGREDHNGTMNAESKTGETKTGPDGKSQTVGQAGAGGKLSTEQRTKISTVIKQQNVKSVTNVNFSISVGTRVPRDVAFQPLPAEVVTIYPEWRGYDFILVRDQILVIEPDTHEIVAVIDA